MDRRAFLSATAASIAAILTPSQSFAMPEIDAGGVYPSKDRVLHKIQVAKRQIFSHLSKSIGFDKTKLILDDICMKIARVKPPFIVSDAKGGNMIYHGLAYDPDILPKNSMLCDRIEFDKAMAKSLGYLDEDIRDVYIPIPFKDIGF